MLIQILISIFALFAISRLVLKFKKTELRISKFFIWLIFWLAVGVVVWIPDATNMAANFLGIGRGADLVFYLSIILIFYLIFRIYIKIEKVEKDITKVVRKDALEHQIYSEPPLEGEGSPRNNID